MTGVQTCALPILTIGTIVSLEPARWRERARRWQRVAKEAAKQCGRAVVPPVEVPRPLADFLAADEPADLRLCFWEGAATTPGEGGGKAGLLGTTLAANLPASLPRDEAPRESERPGTVAVPRPLDGQASGKPRPRQDRKSVV